MSLIEGVLWIEGVPGDLETEEAARYPYDLQFGLIAGGDTLSGGANAVSRPVPGRVGDALTYYAELHRKPAGPAPAGGSRLRSENQ